MCDCHRLSAEDLAIWKKARGQPRTIAQWKALHDALEDYKRRIIEDFKRAPTVPVRLPPGESFRG